MTHNQTYNWRAYCKDSLDQIENYKQAEADGFKGWCMHHRLEIQPDGTRVSAKELIDQNLYFHRPASDLVFMKVGEHRSLHRSLHNIGNTYMKGKHHTEKTRQKISEALKGKHHTEKTRQKMSEALLGENNPLFGKHRSAETRLKISESLKGKHNCNKDSLWWNDGISNKRSKECPGPEWKRGILKKT